MTKQYNTKSKKIVDNLSKFEEGFYLPWGKKFGIHEFWKILSSLFYVNKHKWFKVKLETKMNTLPHTKPDAMQLGKKQPENVSILGYASYDSWNKSEWSFPFNGHSSN